MGVLRGVAKVPRSPASKYGTRPRPGRRHNKPVSSGPLSPPLLPPIEVSADPPVISAEPVMTQAEPGAGAGQQSDEWLCRLESDCSIISRVGE